MLKTINVHGAAIDVGSEQLYVAVGDQAVQVFDTFTELLQALRTYRLEAGGPPVAMEATGVYGLWRCTKWWKPPGWRGTWSTGRT